MRTQVAIIGGGPAGLLLSHMLAREGIDSIVVERQSRAYVLQRIRAGILEAGTVELLRAVGLGGRMDREGHSHDGAAIAWAGRDRFFVDTRKYTGKAMMAYGQTAITEDLYAARDAVGGTIFDEAANVLLEAVTSDSPSVNFEKTGAAKGLIATILRAATASTASAANRSQPRTLGRSKRPIRSAGWQSCRRPRRSASSSTRTTSEASRWRRCAARRSAAITSSMISPPDWRSGPTGAFGRNSRPDFQRTLPTRSSPASQAASSAKIHVRWELKIGKDPEACRHSAVRNHARIPVCEYRPYQPRSLMAQPAFQIFVMWRILSPSNSMT
jgi:hypothetical protein